MAQKFDITASYRRLLLLKVAKLMSAHEGRMSVGELLQFCHDVQPSETCESIVLQEQK